MERLAFAKNGNKLSLRRRCYLLGLNRSTVYYLPHKEEDVWLLNFIREIWIKHTFYGYRKIRAVLRIDYQVEINGKRVLRLMRIAGIQAVYPKPKLSLAVAGNAVYPYMLKGLAIIKADQVWMTDITYLKIGTRFVYLVALIDVYSRYIVGWNISYVLDTENCLDALFIALKNGVPEILNSDQGCQFTSEIWITTIQSFGIKPSMDGKGRCKDNIYIERFWRTIKYEAVYLNDYTSFTELYCGIKQYIEFYNESRPHQSLGYLRPADVYKNGIVPSNRHPDLNYDNRDASSSRALRVPSGLADANP